MRDLDQIISGLADGSVVPYLGPEALRGSHDLQSGEPIPADSDSLILAMNGGRPMAPKLMYEFPRAAMNLELKKGRSFVNNFLTHTYGKRQWSRAPLHDLIASIKPPYVVDINRDTQLQESYAGIPHLLIVGIARVGGTDYRFRLYHYEEGSYQTVEPDGVPEGLPILFKPMGTPLPEPSYIASDADYVDYITELMGGFSIPGFLKAYRKNRRYLLLGLPLRRDTERMVLADIIHGAGEPSGWALIPKPNDKERRFCRKLGLEVIEADFDAFLANSDKEEAALVGC